ncbi:N-acetylmuramoyl-L-alanine amidase [Pseudomonas phage PCS4]|uniref:N-acetylmuramoyl-L-alanine amidase n=1 Tax=Pseudomonas phage PCS4 TaxID=2875705 RepID=A0ABY3P9A2_9CAUD|nr:N-acetylmuramoyl-L-alanine amidase [Pseudomonas phage PCS4]UPW35214.1 lysin [Pseudomonas phage PCS5]
MARRVQFKKRLSTDLLVVHCAATKASMDIGVREIRMWHVQQGWLDCGYHFIIRRDGTIEEGRPHDVVGSHVKGYNERALGICLVGGIDTKGSPEDNFTDHQKAALQTLLWRMTSGKDFEGAYHGLPVVGHRDLDPRKACPSFDAKAWWESRKE